MQNFVTRNIMKYKKTVTVVAVCAVLICVLAVSVFMKREKPVVGARVKEEIKEETEKSEKTAPSKDKIERMIQTDYMEFIEQIREGIADDFQSVSTEELDISPIFQDRFKDGAVKGIFTLGYYFMDLDSDGVDELLFGANNRMDGQNMIYDIYTMKEGIVTHVASGGNRLDNWFKICENGAIRNYYSEKQKGYSAYYKLDRDRLQLIEAVSWKNEKWFYSKEDTTTENTIPISSVQAYEIMESDTYAGKDIMYTPFVEVLTAAEQEDNDTMIFADLSGMEFSFSSGAGAWETNVVINADGSFTGYYHDSDAGSGYYHKSEREECNFSGQFSSMVKTGPYEYTMQCESLVLDQEPGTEAIIDQILVSYSDPYGFEDADEFKLYLPGKKTSQLPAGFLQWSNGTAVAGNLECYGLYNVGGKQGFLGLKKSNDTEPISQFVEEQPEDNDDTSRKSIITSSWSEEKIAEIQAQNYPVTEDLTFRELSRINSFTAKSAITGAFGATIILEEDGTFHGNLSESYRGRFSSLRRTGPYEYTLQLEYLEGVDIGELIDGEEKKSYTDPAGFEEADQFMFYLPGKRYDELPEELLTLLFEIYGRGLEGLFLDDYIMYNVEGNQAFVVVKG